MAKMVEWEVVSPSRGLQLHVFSWLEALLRGILAAAPAPKLRQERRVGPTGSLFQVKNSESSFEVACYAYFVNSDDCTGRRAESQFKAL